MLRGLRQASSNWLGKPPVADKPPIGRGAGGRKALPYGHPARREDGIKVGAPGRLGDVACQRGAGGGQAPPHPPFGGPGKKNSAPSRTRGTGENSCARRSR